MLELWGVVSVSRTIIASNDFEKARKEMRRRGLRFADPGVVLITLPQLVDVFYPRPGDEVIDAGDPELVAALHARAAEGQAKYEHEDGENFDIDQQPPPAWTGRDTESGPEVEIG